MGILTLSAVSIMALLSVSKITCKGAIFSLEPSVKCSRFGTARNTCLLLKNLSVRIRHIIRKFLVIGRRIVFHNFLPADNQTHDETIISSNDFFFFYILILP